MDVKRLMINQLLVLDQIRLNMDCVLSHDDGMNSSEIVRNVDLETIFYSYFRESILLNRERQKQN